MYKPSKLLQWTYMQVQNTIREMLVQFSHYVHTINYKSGFQEVSAETDAVGNYCDGVSQTAAAAVAAPILKLCNAKNMGWAQACLR